MITNKKSYKNQNETILAGKEENKEMSKEHDKNIHTAGYICGTWLLRWLRDIDLGLYIPHFLSIFIRHIQFKNPIDTQRMLYMQEMDPGPAKILQEAEKGFT